MPNNIQEELLALLDNDQANRSCGSLPSASARHQLCRRGSSQLPPDDRSLPPSFKYWASASTKSRVRRKHPDPDDKGGREWIARRIFRIHPADRGSMTGAFQNFVLVVVGVGTFFYAKTVLSRSSLLGSPSSSSSDWERAAPKAYFSFVDPAWRGREEVQYETLSPPSEIDFAIQRRGPRPGEEGECDDLLLFLPQSAPPDAGRAGHAIELNDYLLAALLSTYLGFSMVVLEDPAEIGCPLDDKRERIRARRPSTYDPPPAGLSRLIRHPKWLSRGCPVPCQASYDYKKWSDLRKKRLERVTCQNDNDRQAMVFVVGGEDTTEYFERDWRDQMIQRPSATARDWALRLGAKAHEARLFAELQKEEEIWDYVSALMARSGILRFQPWIARDAKEVIKASGLPLNWPYAAVSVRELGGGGRESLEALTSQSLPFEYYLGHLESTECNDRAHPVYVAADDTLLVRNEIDSLPKGTGGNTILSGCHKLKFLFNPVEIAQPSEGAGARNCTWRHRISISSIADLMILSKSDTFVGDFNSGIGRLVRVFRTAVNDHPGRRRDGPVLVRNARDTSRAMPLDHQGA